MGDLFVSQNLSQFIFLRFLYYIARLYCIIIFLFISCIYVIYFANQMSSNHLSYNSSQMEELLRRAAAARRSSVESSSSLSSSLYFEGWDYDEDYPSSLSSTPLRGSIQPTNPMPKLVDRGT